MPEFRLRPSNAEDATIVTLESVSKKPGTAESATILNNQYEFRCGDLVETFESVALQRSAGCLIVNGKTSRYHAVRRDDTILVWIGGKVHTFEIDKRTTRRGGTTAPAATTQLIAPMPGTILKIHVATGTEFQAHTPLVIMESMKMEMTLSAHSVGRVREVLCAEGDLVKMGATLIRFEDDESK